MRSLKEKCCVVCILWVNLSLECPLNYLRPNTYITSLKDLFHLEGGELTKLVDSNMTNKPMGPKSL